MKVQEVLIKLKRVFVKRKYKDILFRFVFREKAELLQLYNAINKTNYTNPDDLIITTMEDVIYMGMKNDLSFLLANELNLYEHQSTENQNMPLRGLLYFAKLYESYIESNGLNRYQKKRIPLPFPRFIVFYNGEAQMKDEETLCLSQAFDKTDEEPAVECIARFININYGCNKELMENCQRLAEYSQFIQCVREHLSIGYNHKQAVVKAVDECISKGILEDVLVKHRAEVFDMFLTKFDKKMYEEAIRQEGRDELTGKYEELTKGHEELAKEHEELAKEHEELERSYEELTQRQYHDSIECAESLRDNGVSYEVVRKSMPMLDNDTLDKIFGRK